MRNYILIIFVLLAGHATAESGDNLVIKGKIVNLREGPSTSYPILLKLEEGRKIVELQRQDNWVQVMTGREDVRSGWVYSALVGHGPVPAPPETVEKNIHNVETVFELFELTLVELNEKLRMRIGFIAFTGTQDLGHGSIQVTAAEDWLGLPRTQREGHLSDVFDIWSAAIGDSVSITVHVVDSEGERHMSMLR